MQQFYNTLSKYRLVIAYLGSLTAFAIGLYTLRSGNDVIGALIIGGSLLISSTSFLYGKMSLLEERINEVCQILNLLNPASVGLTKIFLDRRLAEFKDAVTAIRQGQITIETEEEWVEAIREIVRSARHTLHTVDQLDLNKWINSPALQEYLDTQMRVVKQGRIIERIRIVDQSRMTDEGYIHNLQRYITAQQAAGVQLLLCFRDQIDKLKISSIEKGLVIVDKDHPGLICGTRGIMLGGVMVEGSTYLADSDAVRKLKKEYEILYNSILRQDLDRQVRDKLA